MNFDIKLVKISVTIPPENVEAVRNAVCEAGAGIIGNYDYCSYASKVVGTFRPNDQANPYIGENNKLEFVDEINLEFICPIEKAKEVVAVLRQAIRTRSHRLRLFHYWMIYSKNNANQTI